MERLKIDECQNCKNWKGYVTDCFKNCMYMKPIDALEEFNRYKELEERGLLLKLPCKVGDTVYATFGGEVSKCIVRGILWRDDKIWLQDGNGSNLGTIGKTVFLTQAEAEEALKRMEKEGTAWRD